MKVLSFLEERKINVISNVPTTARLATPYLKEFDLNSIKYTFFSGEALYPYEAKAWMEAMPKAMHFNAYGPTETTIVCSEICLNDLSEDYFKSNAPLPIGIPFEGTNFQIEKNELIIEGDQVFQGYINEPKKRIDGYQSGDLVEVDENGQYIFKGRKDDQVQIQGYRVELLEVENCIQSILNKPSVCFFLENLLVAAIETDVQIPEQDLSSQIGERLPDYMIPKRYFQMKCFPLNSNQKLDRLAILNRIKQST
jgi:acyl-coenzyme A synthetase/AMP-(fatty) acid ligase